MNYCIILTASCDLLAFVRLNYSVLKFFTGLDLAALTAWKVTVNRESIYFISYPGLYMETRLLLNPGFFAMARTD